MKKYEFVSDAINEVYEARLRAQMERLSIEDNPSLASALANNCQSEIEQRMLVELFFADWRVTDFRTLDIHDATMPFPIDPRSPIVLAPQLPIGPYRADIAILVKHFSGRSLAIAVECDGHDFHERTKEQAERDKKRDRDMQKAGWMVFRFTGSEIFRKGGERAAEVADFAYSWWCEQSGYPLP